MSFRISAATVKGPHHRRRDEPNQDAFHAFEGEGFVLVAAADGAGSLEKSHEGAHLAVHVATAKAVEAIEAGDSFAEALEQALAAARETLLAQAEASLMGCTLALGALSQTEWGLAVVGDAFGVASREDGTHELVQPPSHSEFANITRLLTSKEYEPLIVSHSETVAGVSVATDGMTHATIKEGSPVAGFWTPMVRRVQTTEFLMGSLLEHMDAQERLDDDTTLAMAVLKAD